MSFLSSKLSYLALQYLFCEYYRYCLPNIENFGEILIVEQNDDNFIKTRTYDVSVSYDFFYRVPRFWLYGYSENGSPLTDKEVKEDIMLWKIQSKN